MIRVSLRTEWRRPIGCLKLQVIFRKRATKYRALLQKMTCKDKASYDSTPPCRNLHLQIVFLEKKINQRAFGNAAHYISAHYINAHYINAHYINAHYISAHYINAQYINAHYIRRSRHIYPQDKMENGK